jgi:hypothetical protein
MSQYVVPQALIYQEFTATPEAITEVMRACIVGPNYQVVKDVGEGRLGTYDPSQEVCYSWPNREAGAVVDEDFTRVFIDEALLQYFYNSEVSGDDIKGTYCQALDLSCDSAVKNIIHASATNFKTANGYTRAVALKNRDVTIGDVIKVEATIGPATTTFWTYVAGFCSDMTAGIVGAATEDVDNAGYPAEQSSSVGPAVAWDKIGFPASSVDITAAATPPNHPEQGYIDGVSSDTYLIEVVTAGEPDAAVLRVTSASGTDDVAELTASDWGVPTLFGNKDLSITFDRSASDAFEVGMAWELSVVFGSVDVDPVSGGTYDGPSDTTYIITVTKGGEFGGAEGNPEITISTSTGIDSSGPHEVSSLNEVISIGSYGITVMFTSSIGGGQGLYFDDKYYVVATAPAEGAVRSLVLGHNLPDTLLGISAGVCGTAPNLSVWLYIKKDIEVERDRTGYAPLVNWTTSPTEICVQDGIIAYDSTWVDNSGAMLPLLVKSGTVWTMYRALRTADADELGTVSSISDIETELGSGYDVYNPMSVALYFALLNANGTDVKYISVSSDDLAGYTDAVGQLQRHDDMHGIVPLTSDIAVIDMIEAHVNAMSTAESGRWRRVWVSRELMDDSVIVDASDNSGNPIMATISDDPGTSGDQYTLVEITTANIDVVVLGAKAGDILRCKYTTDGFGNEAYEEYTIDSVLSGNGLRLLTGPATAVNVASKIEIWRTLDVDERATAIKALGASYANRRVTNVWPDYFTYGSTVLEGYYLAAALAGLRSGVVPQRSLTNTGVAGPTAVPRTTDFSEDELNTIASGGNLIVSQWPAGSIYVRHNLTTDMTSVSTKEESISANLDSISYFLLAQIEPYIGVANLTQETIDQIKVEIEDAISFLKDNSTTITVGGQLVDGSVTSIERHPTQSDRLVVVVSLDLPEPLNNVEVHLVV